MKFRVYFLAVSYIFMLWSCRFSLPKDSLLFLDINDVVLTYSIIKATQIHCIENADHTFMVPLISTSPFLLCSFDMTVVICIHVTVWEIHFNLKTVLYWSHAWYLLYVLSFKQDFLEAANIGKKEGKKYADIVDGKWSSHHRWKDNVFVWQYIQPIKFI